MSILSKLFGSKPSAPEATEADEPLLIVPVPALVSVLLHHEKAKGSPLIEAEVIEITDKAACIVMPLSVANKVVEQRGYADIDPERAWEEWRVVRTTL